MVKEIENFVLSFEKASTQRIYRGHLNTFFENIKANPKTYFKDGRDYQQDLLDYWSSLKDYAPCTKVNKITAIKQFMEENDILINRKTWNLIKRQKKYIPQTIDHVPTPAELKSILTHGGIKEKSLFLVMASSGIRIDEALSITLNDIELYDERHNLRSPAKIKIRQEISKNDTPRITFMSDEARDTLIEWLKVRDEYLNAAVRRLAKLHIEKKLNDDRVFPYAWATAWTMWSRLLHKSKLDKRNKATKKNVTKKGIGRDRYEIHIHTLRKFFMNRMKGVARIDAVEQLAGHEGYLDRSYRRLNEEELIEAYKQGMASVTIFENAPQLSDQMIQLQEKNKELESRMQRMMEDMQHLLIENDKKNKK